MECHINSLANTLLTLRNFLPYVITAQSPSNTLVITKIACDFLATPPKPPGIHRRTFVRSFCALRRTFSRSLISTDIAGVSGVLSHLLSSCHHSIQHEAAADTLLYLRADGHLLPPSPVPVQWCLRPLRPLPAVISHMADAERFGVLRPLILTDMVLIQVPLFAWSSLALSYRSVRPNDTLSDQETEWCSQ